MHLAAERGTSWETSTPRVAEATPARPAKSIDFIVFVLVRLRSARIMVENELIRKQKQSRGNSKGSTSCKCQNNGPITVWSRRSHTTRPAGRQHRWKREIAMRTHFARDHLRYLTTGDNIRAFRPRPEGETLCNIVLSRCSPPLVPPRTSCYVNKEERHGIHSTALPSGGRNEV
jgi:hypothetical protein